MFKTIRNHIASARSAAANHLRVSHDGFMYALIAILAIIGPLFFIPQSGFAVGVGKGFFVLAVAIIMVVASGIATLRRGTITIPRGWMMIFLGAMVGMGLLGAVLSGAFRMSLFGYGFETTSWLFIAILALVIIVSSRVMRSYERIGMLLGGILIPFAILFLVHLVRYIVGPSFANFGTLTSTISTMIGSWGDLSIFFGLIALFSVLTLEMGGFKKPVRRVMEIIGGLAVLFLAFANVRMVWIVIGLIALFITLYLFSYAYWDANAESYRKERRVPGYAIALFIITLVCIGFGNIFHTIAARHQSIVWNDARPTMTMTARTGIVSFLHNPATGYGPNLFSAAWTKAKPPALSGVKNDFSYGFGWVPTQLATNGLLGAVAWLGFFGCLIWSLWRRMTGGFEHAIDRYVQVVVMTFIIYLGIIAWVYIPGTYLLILMGIMVGSHIGLGVVREKNTDRERSFINDPRTSFFGILGVIAIILAGLMAAYIGVRKYSSFAHYAKGQILIADGNRQAGFAQITTASLWAAHDVYHRDLARMAAQDVASLSSSTSSGALSKQVEQTLGIALGHAQAAVAENPTDYTNHLVLGDVYRLMAGLGIDGAADKARGAYDTAIARNPNDATLLLPYAELDLVTNQSDAALTQVNKSINQYPTAAAYILAAQIQVNRRNMTAAIAALDRAVALDPYNATLAYQYGLVLFGQKQYTQAVSAFIRTIAINRAFGPAYVYLGVAYEKTGNMERANQVYDAAKRQFPGAADAIAQVKSGLIEAPAPETADDTDGKTSPVAPKSKTP